MASTEKKSRFSQFLLGVLLYTILVILWGAWVRISHSGDGCGDTWPLCHGQIVPQAQQAKTWVELSHRLMSGLFGILIVGLFLKIRKAFDRHHPIQRWALFSLIFTISEALLGAKLVLFKLVSSNDSPYRAFVMALHLINSLMLTGSIAMTWEFSKSPFWRQRSQHLIDFKKLTSSRLIGFMLFVFICIAVTGAIAALSNTLFPTNSLSEGFAADWNPDSHFLIRLRGFHPIAGILLGGSLALAAYLTWQTAPESALMIRKRSLILAIITTIAIVFGITTLLSLAPVWMKLGHLFIAHSVWICLVLWISSLRWE